MSRQVSRSAPRDLGSLVKSFSPNLGTFIVFLVISVVCGLFGLYTGLNAVTSYAAPPGVFEEINPQVRAAAARSSALISVGMLLMSITCAIGAWYQRSVRIDVFEKGFVARRGLEKQEAIWREVESIGEEGRRILVRTTGGKDIVLRGLQFMDQVGELIAKKSSRIFKKAT